MKIEAGKYYRCITNMLNSFDIGIIYHSPENCYLSNNQGEKMKCDQDDLFELAEESKTIVQPEMRKENPVYILQKDLPNAPKGSKLELENIGCPKGWYSLYGNRDEMIVFASYDVENMKDWFKKEEPKEFTESDMIALAKDIQRTYYGCKEGAERGAIEWINEKRKCST